MPVFKKKRFSTKKLPFCREEDDKVTIQFFDFTTSLREKISSETKQRKSQIVVSEILYCRNLIYYLQSSNSYKLRLSLSKKFEFSSQLVFVSSQSSIYQRLAINCRDKKVFQGFPKFLRSEYLIFQSVNKTLFTPACSLLDNSFC